MHRASGDMAPGVTEFRLTVTVAAVCYTRTIYIFFYGNLKLKDTEVTIETVSFNVIRTKDLVLSTEKVRRNNNT